MLQLSFIQLLGGSCVPLDYCVSTFCLLKIANLQRRHQPRMRIQLGDLHTSTPSTTVTRHTIGSISQRFACTSQQYRRGMNARRRGNAVLNTMTVYVRATKGQIIEEFLLCSNFKLSSGVVTPQTPSDANIEILFAAPESRERLSDAIQA